MKLIRGERLDKKERLPRVNCAGCMHKLGRLCTRHGAFLQTNQHKPTDCEYWKEKDGD